MKVLIVEPGRVPYEADVPNELKALHEIVGGYIEIVQPFQDKIALVCDEEGKLKGYAANRSIGVDMIVGTCVLTGYDEEEGELTDLPDEMIRKYKKW